MDIHACFTPGSAQKTCVALWLAHCASWIVDTMRATHLQQLGRGAHACEGVNAVDNMFLSRRCRGCFIVCARQQEARGGYKIKVTGEKAASVPRHESSLTLPLPLSRLLIGEHDAGLL
eukprot:1158274-Pelagomonas_calceolata.AAC.6